MAAEPKKCEVGPECEWEKVHGHENDWNPSIDVGILISQITVLVLGLAEILLIPDTSPTSYSCYFAIEIVVYIISLIVYTGLCPVKGLHEIQNGIEIIICIALWSVTFGLSIFMVSYYAFNDMSIKSICEPMRRYVLAIYVSSGLMFLVALGTLGRLVFAFILLYDHHTFEHRELFSPLSKLKKLADPALFVFHTTISALLVQWAGWPRFLTASVIFMALYTFKDTLLDFIRDCALEIVRTDPRHKTAPATAAAK